MQTFSFVSVENKATDHVRENPLYRKRPILYLHKSHNTPLLPSKILHNHCLCLLRHEDVPREIETNAYANFGGWGGGGKRGVLWDLCK